MKKKDYKIHIIGAGISGLIAAKVLEDNGYEPVVIEATERVGGRLKTDIVEGYQLDHGFQVLLDAYPKAQEFLDLEDLQLQRFLPGAVIYANGKKQTIGDPLRNMSLLMPTVLSSVGGVGDKLKVLKLNKALKKKSIDQIFQTSEQTTHEYLRQKGFSDSFISNFFKPFFSGIFLEPNLDTSSRMFEFVYKMFGEGHATLPKAGIETIPKQLKSKLRTTEFIFNSKVAKVEDQKLILENGKTIPTHFTIIASDTADLIPNLKDGINWKSCENFYFEVDKRTIDEPLIGLIADQDSLINNIFFHTSLGMERKGNKELLSVTIVKDHNLTQDQLLEKVIKDLKTYCGIINPRFIKQYSIPRALPDLTSLTNDYAPTESRLKATIFLAGDQLMNGSLNAAL